MTISEKKITITAPADMAAIMQKILWKTEENDNKKEHFWSIGFNSRNVIQYIELVSLGTLNASIVHPREVFRLAIQKSIASIIIVHNHPSDVVEPSEEDLDITKRLQEAGKLLGIEVIDHIIISTYKFCSLKEKGIFTTT